MKKDKLKTDRKKVTPKRIARVTKKINQKKVIMKKSTPKKIISKKVISKLKKEKKTSKSISVKSKSVPIPFTDTEEIPHYLLRTLVDIYYDFQGQRIQTQLRIGASKREHSLTDEELSVYGITTIFENAQSFEKDLEKLITKQLKNHALYTQYLSKIRGIGPLLSAGLIAYIDNIERFKNVSSLWQYSGYGMNRFCKKCKKPTFVDVKYETGKTAKKLNPKKNCPICNEETIPVLQKRTPGYQSNWNDRLKVLGWKSGSSFVKQSTKSKYRKLYDQIKAEENRKNPTRKKIDGKIFYNDGHKHNRAMRKVVKIFFAHVWQTWRRQQGLEATEPYAKQLLGHSVVEAFTDK